MYRYRNAKCRTKSSTNAEVMCIEQNHMNSRNIYTAGEKYKRI